MPPELVRIDGEIVAVRLGGQNFDYEPENSESIIPESVLTGFRLSEIPTDLIIKPTKSISKGYIEMDNNIGFSCYSGGQALVSVEVMLRRKYWNGDVGLTPYVEALRQAVHERDDTRESDFQDDGDYVFLFYEIVISEDLEIQDAVTLVLRIIGSIDARADGLVRRRPDPLLGIFDRGSFDADLAHALQRQKPGIALILADIDHFKSVNDEHGHQVGDAVLQAVAQVLQTQSARIGATSYRYGGEELATIIWESDPNSAMDFAESFRQTMTKWTFVTAPRLHVTVSLGVAVSSTTKENPEELVKRADAALYAAKQGGRDRTCAAPSIK